MTREEAIRIFRKEIECLSHAKCEDCILEKVCDPAKTTPLDSEYIEAYGMAIQALSQEPCDDAISREAVIMECIKYANHEHNVQLKKEVSETRKHDARVIIYACDYFKTFVEKLPSVTQKPGKWILTIEDWNKWTCSKCGYVKRTDIHVNIGWKYCPNCGSAMKGE